MQQLQYWSKAAFAFLAYTALSSGALAAQLVVKVTGIQGTQGQIVVRLYGSADGFPSDARKAVAAASGSIAGDSVTLTLTDVKPGEYALIAIHDANKDGVMEKTLLGLPEEGYGVSTNPRPLAVPRYNSGRFTISDGDNAIEVGLVYY